MWYNSPVVMMGQYRNSQKPLPTVFQTIRIGFDLTTKHWWLMLPPFLLDCFLWLGPQLRMSPLGSALYNWWLSLVSEAPSLQPLLQPDLQQLIAETVEKANLFSQVSVPLIGVPTLMDGVSSLSSPITPHLIVLTTWQQLLLYYAIVTFAGFFASAIYFSLIVRVVSGDNSSWAEYVRQLIPTTLRLIQLGLAMLLVVVLSATPVILIGSFAAIVSLWATFVILLGGTVIVMWTIVYLSFSVFALLYYRTTVLAAVRTSALVIQRNLPVALPLLLAVILIRNVADSLWIAADNGSFLSVVSLAGHAFIGTAMLVATCVFYRDRTEADPIFMQLRSARDSISATRVSQS